MKFDVAVVGGGPGGYEAAIRCAQYGKRTALIEARELGGTCLNRGCIPTKALLHGAEVYETAKTSETYGIATGEVTCDYARLVEYKDGLVSRLRKGVAGLEKAHGVTVIKGFGVLTDAHTIQVGDQSIQAEFIILATGSAPSRPPIPGADSEKVLTSDELLEMKTCPESLVIIGGGVIGLEFASLYATLGKKVVVLEMLPSILNGMDAELAGLLTKLLEKKGVVFVTNAKVTRILDGGQIGVEYEKDGTTETALGNICLMSIGRRPQTVDIGCETVGISMTRGFVDVDGHLRTSVPNIYAIGDITGKMQLAHVATAQGMVAAANCSGRDAVMRYNIIPACVYTFPEIASVGLTRAEAEKNGRQVKCGSFNVATNGKAMILGTRAGMARLVTDALTGEILGAQIMAPRATDMIAEVAAVMRSEGTIEELADTIHPHPTICEVILEAAHDVEGLCCNAMPRK